MGQQQLLLIVLVMILVGTAILIGTQIFDASNREKEISSISQNLIYLSSDAIKFFRTPSALGGGGQSFTSASGEWNLPTNLTSANGRAYSIISISKNSIEILGESLDEQTGLDKTKGVQVYLKFNEYGVIETRIDN